MSAGPAIGLLVALGVDLCASRQERHELFVEIGATMQWASKQVSRRRGRLRRGGEAGAFEPQQACALHHIPWRACALHLTADWAAVSFV